MSGKFFRVSATPLFEADMLEVVGYTATRLGDPAGAVKFVDAITAAVFERLADPEKYEPYQAGHPHPYPYYLIHVGGYTVYYVVIGNAMELRRLCYNGRAPGDPSAAHLAE